MDEADLQERMSSGAWAAAERRSRERGRPLTRRSAMAEVSGLEAQIGLPHRIERLVAIERETERLHARLREEWQQLAQEHAGDPNGFGEAWRRRVREISYLEVNELVDVHNEWFPIEARLRWDLALDDYRAPFGLPWRKQRLDAAWALERFPPRLDAVPAPVEHE